MRALGRFGLGIGLVLLAACGASAQFAASSTNPLIIGDGGGSNDNPLTVAAPDGGAYVLWRSTNANGHYDTRVQRLSATGVELWPHNGVVVGDSESSFTIVGGADMDLASDGGVVVTCDGVDPIYPGKRQFYVQKLSAAGVKLWGSGGIGVPVLHSNFDSFPAAVCGMPDGGCVVGVSLALTPKQIYFMRFNASGGIAAGWNPSNPPKIPQYTLGASLTCLRSGGADGSFIASWHLSATQSQFVTQKFTGLGTIFPGWPTVFAPGTPAGVVLDNHGLTSFYFPKFISDGAGGGIYAWQSYGSVVMFGQTVDALLQHIHSDGTLQFPSGPVFTVNAPYLNTTPIGNADPSLGRFSPSVAYNPTTQNYFVASYQGSRSSGSSTSVLVQKINAAGTRLWTDSGFFITQEPGGGNVLCTATNDDGCMVFGTITRSSQVKRANFVAKVVDDGFGGGMNAPAWGSSLRFFNSDTTTDKGRMSVVTSVGSDDAIIAYGIGSGGGSTMAAAKITAATGAPSVVPTPAFIVSDLPPTVAACEGDVVTLSIVADGTPNITYQWYRHYGYSGTGNPDAAWLLNDGQSFYGCAVPDDGTLYSGTSTPTLTITGVHRLPAVLSQGGINPCTQTSDESLNSYRCAIFNSVNTTPVFSGWAQMVISGKCHADFNCNGDVTVDDIFTFLNSWFATDPRADFNYSGTVTVDDIFVYLNAWFSGCQ